jgi:hypothetical protein
MSKSPEKSTKFCYNIISGKICGESKEKYFHGERHNKCMKCSEVLKEDDLVPLHFFETLAEDFMADLQCDKVKSLEMYNEVLKEYPFCKHDDKLRNYKFGHIKKISNNKKINYEEKVRRITSVLINLAYEQITTSNADIGTLETIDRFCPVKTCRPIEEEYKYYKNAFERKLKKD